MDNSPNKGHKDIPHDVLVSRLRKRIDEQEELLKEYYVKMKELEGKIEELTK